MIFNTTNKYRRSYELRCFDLILYTLALIASFSFYLIYENVILGGITIGLIPVWIYFGLFAYLAVRRQYIDICQWRKDWNLE
jgi:hypothetical protein